MIVDASALTDLVAPTARGAAVGARFAATRSALCAPDLIEVEVASALRSLERRGELPAAAAEAALGDVRDLGLTYFPSARLLPRAWELRANMTIYDGIYVALAEATQLPLLTTDARLARAASDHSNARVDRVAL